MKSTNKRDYAALNLSALSMASIIYNDCETPDTELGFALTKEKVAALLDNSVWEWYDDAGEVLYNRLTYHSAGLVKHEIFNDDGSLLEVTDGNWDVEEFNFDTKTGKPYVSLGTTVAGVPQNPYWFYFNEGSQTSLGSTKYAGVFKNSDGSISHDVHVLFAKK